MKAHLFPSVFLVPLILFLAACGGTDSAPPEEGARGGAERVYAVEGMHCEGCSRLISSTLGKLEGVEQAGASFAEEQAVVTVSDAGVPDSDIITAIEELGYTATRVE